MPEWGRLPNMGFPQVAWTGRGTRGFQTQVFPQPVAGTEGDFCDHNPRASVDAGPGGLVAGPEGVWIAHFAWLSPSILDPNSAPAIATSYSNGGPVAGFVHRHQQGLITDYLGGSSMHLPGGFMVTLHQAGGFFVRNKGDGYAFVGMQAYARLFDGAVLFGPPTSRFGGINGTNSQAPGDATIAGAVTAQTFDLVGSILGNVLTVTEVTNGVIQPGAVLSGDNVVEGTRVMQQLHGQQPGGIGVYGLNIGQQVVASGTEISGEYGELEVTSIDAGGSVSIGAMLGPTSNGPAFVTGHLTGTGNVGTYIVDSTSVAAPTTLSSVCQTKWFATSSGNPGELVKMSSWPLG